MLQKILRTILKNPSCQLFNCYHFKLTCTIKINATIGLVPSNNSGIRFDMA